MLNLSDFIPGLLKRRARGPREHMHNDERSVEWNAWRARQALGPRGVFHEIGHRPRQQAVTMRELQIRRNSSRASRRRMHRRASLEANARP